MTKKTRGTRKKTGSVRDLAVNKDSDVKGGSLLSSVSNALKSIGEGLASAARKG